jgi:hypothetical protein
MVPHGLVNVGDEPVKVVGFFCESEIVSTFDEPIQPIGQAALTQGAPVPAWDLEPSTARRAGSIDTRRRGSAICFVKWSVVQSDCMFSFGV